MANITAGFNASALNATINGTDDTSPLTPWQTLQNFDFMLMEFKLVGSALGIIFLGAHASLRRPPSAAPKSKHKKEAPISQGLELSDAVMFPLLAGTMLVGLYYLIQWLKDPAILSKILRYYMTTISVASMVTLYAHGTDLLSSFVFPKYWRGWDGVVRKTDQKCEKVVKCDEGGNVAGEESKNPLPGVLGLFAPTKGIKERLWRVRGLLRREWVFKLFVKGMGEEKTNVKLTTLMAIPAAAITAVVYFGLNTPFLSNLLGYGMCYCSFMLLSPTDLLISTLVLVGLFFYDIVMVFYTPYMITVATTLDVPIKLQFSAGKRQSILGLGDIVIPGMFIAWALRLDLWLFYLRKIKYESTSLQIVEKSSSGEITTRTETKHKEVKAPYVNVKGNWGERFWLRGSSVPELEGAKFPKVYFYATLAGYLGGMLATLAMLLVFRRGQPALLYLVPGVLGAVYVTALWRGELKKIWGYTEDGSLDVVDVVVDLEDGKKKVGRMRDGVVDLTKGEDEVEKEEEKKKKEKEEADKKEAEKKGKSEERRVFYISLEAPEL